jgi:formylglycine-generating enzyme required for sulfatase activity/predicted Ser/Thr protein kinase
MPEENDPLQSPPPPEEPTLLGDAAADESWEPVMRTIKMTSASGGTWQPPSIEETAQLFPGYEVIKLLGRGGMGAVYQARQIELDRLVAIKLLPREISVDKDFADRFRREARAMARLHHPNIITVFDFGTTARGHLFFAMEYIEGANLADVIRQSGLNGEQALSIVEQICTALAYAHGKGIIHRDIKPANVMIDTESHVKVADFGLARLTDPSAEPMGHTMTGTIMGTPDYMAPEQGMGMDVDQRADIYSVGVMLYEMLCRQVPKGIFQPPSHRTGCDTRIDAIVIKAMQQAPDHRYQSTTEMKADVIAARTPLALAAEPVTQAVHPRPIAQPALPEPKAPVMKAIAPPAAKKSRLPIFAGIAVILLVVVGGGLYFSKIKPKVMETVQPKRGTPTSDAEPWRNVLGDPAQLALEGAVERTPEGLRFRAAGSALFRPPKRDAAIRLRATFGGSRVTLCARTNHAGKYQLYNYEGKALVLERHDAAADRWITLRSLPLPQPLQPGQDYELELRVVGQTLTAKLNGEVLGTVTDGTLTDGTFGVNGIGRDAAPALIKSLEVLDLDAPGAAPASAPVYPAAEPWQDLLSAPARLGLFVGAAVTPQGLLLPQNAAANFRAGGSHGALRIKTVYPHNVALRARSNDRATANYWLVIVAPDKLRLKRTLGADTEVLRDFVLPQPLAAGAEYELELRAVGATLSVTLDGTLLGEVHDEALPGGVFSVSNFSRDPVTLKALQFLPLPSTPADSSSVVTASSATPFVNTLGMKFVPVSITGGPTGGERVLFSIWETRVQDYEVFATETQREWPKPDFEQGPTHPAVNVSWDDAQDFCTWLTDRERKAGKITAKERYLLPSDHEWSCAVGIGEREDAAQTPEEKNGKLEGVYPWGRGWPPPADAGNFTGEEMQPDFAAKHYPWLKAPIAGYRDAFTRTSPVGSYAPDGPGLYDLNGNVREWCEDLLTPDATTHVVRGGSWGLSDEFNLRSSSRNSRIPNQREPTIGFRVVLASIAPPPRFTSHATPVPAPAATPAPTPAAAAATPKPASEVEKWLAQVDGPQQEAFQKQVLKPYEASVADLRARYIASLEAGIARASAASQLAEALALRAERQNFEQAKNVASDDAGVPASIKALRSGFRVQLARIEQDRASKAKALHTTYDAVLAQNETLLTQRQRLDDALLLKNKRAELASAWLVPIASGPAPFAAAGLPFVNSLGMKFVPVPITGGPTDKQRVLFSIWETRVQDFAVYATETRAGYTPADFEQTPMHPVVEVSWDDAQAFCAWLTKKEGRTYRLPSDHEWSCAAGLGSREDARLLPDEKSGKIPKIYPWEKAWPPPLGAGNFGDSAAQSEKAKPDGKYLTGYTDGFAYTAPVGSFAANRFGLYDLSGNAREWCDDWGDKEKTWRVIRGGSWYHADETALLSSYRERGTPTGHSGTTGFRIVLAPSAP